ncbi:small nuclear RNA activating complex (SNAPc), partial [Striga asiatica]
MLQQRSLSRYKDSKEVMDLKPFKLDIDELIQEFAESESTTLTEFKKIWLSRKFSFIFEARPSTNQGFFMQSLYAHSIGHMISAGSLSIRLGGLYCLYCLYETQPFKPPSKIYLSLGELRQLKTLALEAKTRGVKMVSTLLKSMLERNMFLFGFVGVNEDSATKRVNELTDIQNARVQTAYRKLFADSRLGHFIHMGLGTELDVNLLKEKSSDYALAKEIAIKEAGQVIDVQNITHIVEDKRVIGEVVEKAATDWNSEKEMLYERTGLPVALPQDNEEEQEEEEENEYASYNQNMQNGNKEEADTFDSLRAAHREHFSPVDETTGGGPTYEQHRAGEPFEMPQVSAAPASAIDLQPSSPSQPRRNDRTLTGRQNAAKNGRPRLNLRWVNLVLDPDPDNIVAVGLTGLLTWASVQF